MCQEKVWAMLKKRKNREICMSKSMRKIIHAKSMRKRKKERNKNSPYFQRQPSKKRESHVQRSTKIFRIRKILKISHTCTILIKVYDLHILGSSF
jgi:hypothetical protein